MTEVYFLKFGSVLISQQVGNGPRWCFSYGTLYVSGGGGFTLIFGIWLWKKCIWIFVGLWHARLWVSGFLYSFTQYTTFPGSKFPFPGRPGPKYWTVDFFVEFNRFR